MTEREQFEAAMLEAGYHKPERGPFDDSQYKYERDADRFVGWTLARATPADHESDWIAKLRKELMLSKMTHNFTFSRDEVIGLLGGKMGVLSTPADHSDDRAVDDFARLMKQKMAASRAKGRGGWDDPNVCSVESLSAMLHEHVAKGDPVDVANFCMMLRHYDAKIAPADQEPVGYFEFDTACKTWDEVDENFKDDKGIVPLFAAPHPPQNAADHIEAQSVPISERLIAAIEGECDGLAITAEQASNILAYLQYGAPMDDILKDAQRYRKLRDADIDSVSKGGVFAGLTPNNVVINGEDLDIAVDLLIDAKEKS